MKKQLPTWLWALIAAASVPVIGWLQWMAGYDLNFFLFYFLPVSVGAWYLGFGAAVTLSVFSALMWFGAVALSGHVYASQVYAVWNTTIRLGSFLAMGLSVAKMRQALDHERSTAETLRRVLSEVKVLETLLPICVECKKIRDQKGAWQRLEVYFETHANTEFSHGYCPDCAKKAMAAAGLDQDTKP